MPRKPPPEPDHNPRHAPEPIDINRVVSFNLKAARELRGLTQEQLARRLEEITGSRLSQAGVSALERTWEGGKRREFDAQELVNFATALDIPIVWFFLPPPGDRREIKNAGRSLFSLIELLVGRAEQLPLLEQRLRDVGLSDPTAEEQISQLLTGHPDVMTPQVIRELRERMIAQLLNEEATEYDHAAEIIGAFWDRARQATIRGTIAALTNNDRFSRAEPELPSPPANPRHPMDAARATTTGDTPSGANPVDSGTDDTAAVAATAQQA